MAVVMVTDCRHFYGIDSPGICIRWGRLQTGWELSRVWELGLWFWLNLGFLCDQVQERHTVLVVVVVTDYRHFHGIDSPGICILWRGFQLGWELIRVWELGFTV